MIYVLYNLADDCRIIELVSVMESLFPLNNMKNTTHQLIHLVESIVSIGPIRCWWEFYGERLNHAIKETLPPGGLASERVSIRKLLQIEVGKMKSFFNKTPTISHDKTAPNTSVFWSWTTHDHSSMVFKPDKIYLCQAEKANTVYHCDAWELEELFRIAKRRSPDSKLKGRLLEITDAYKLWKRRRDDGLGGNRPTMIDWYRSRACSTKDKTSLAQLMLIRPFKTIFKEGVRFLCRGICARERGPPSEVPRERCNVLNAAWFNKLWYSSLCEIATRSDGEIEIAANLNAAWAIDFPEDASIHGVKVASATCRNLTQRDMPVLDPDEDVNQEWPSKQSIDGNDTISYNPKYRIVDIDHDIFPYN